MQCKKFKGELLGFAVLTGFEDYKGQFENGCIIRCSSKRDTSLENIVRTTGIRCLLTYPRQYSALVKQTGKQRKMTSETIQLFIPI